jgi:hypothetical protein
VFLFLDNEGHTVAMGATVAKQVDWTPEYHKAEKRALSVHGGPTATTQRLVEMPAGRQLPHPTKLPPNSWEEQIMKNRMKMQFGNAKQIREAADWTVKHNANRWMAPQGERRVKFIL